MKNASIRTSTIIISIIKQMVQKRGKQKMRGDAVLLILLFFRSLLLLLLFLYSSSFINHYWTNKMVLFTSYRLLFSKRCNEIVEAAKCYWVIGSHAKSLNHSSTIKPSQYTRTLTHTFKQLRSSSCMYACKYVCRFIICSLLANSSWHSDENLHEK